MKVIAYTRVSTTDQAENGYGLDAQRAAIAREAEHRGWEVEWTEDAGVSGASRKRPGLEHALSLLRDGSGEALVVAKLDRLGRTVSGLSRVIDEAVQHGWSLIVLDMGIDSTTSGGRMILRVLSALAEWEREQIQERTRAGLAAAKDKGVVPGPKSTVPAEVTARVLGLHAEQMSLTAIAHLLTTDGVPLPSGQPGMWQPSQVRRVLSRAAASR